MVSIFQFDTWNQQSSSQSTLTNSTDYSLFKSLDHNVLNPCGLNLTKLESVYHNNNSNNLQLYLHIWFFTKVFLSKLSSLYSMLNFGPRGTWTPHTLGPICTRLNLHFTRKLHVNYIYIYFAGS